MELMLGGRGSGKTHKMVQAAAKSNARLVCINQEECKRVKALADSLDLDILEPITFGQFLYYGYNRISDSYMIDNVDMLIESLSAKPIKAVSMTFGGMEDAGS